VPLDDERFVPARREVLAKRLEGETTTHVVLCGHSHRQAVIHGPRECLILNPGSVGCPDDNKGLANDAGRAGFADFKNSKPGDEALHETRFPCHQRARDRDFVFARYGLCPELKHVPNIAPMNGVRKCAPGPDCD
jgi:diadenosine tetraphosphatase ApaH/serine/threonine PP2A family protein phosphatase